MDINTLCVIVRARPCHTFLTGLHGDITGGAGFEPRTKIRIMSNDGSLLSSMPFPPRDLALRVQSARLPLNRRPGDVLAIGFTSRCVLVVVLRDSLTLCYDLSGSAVLPPFFALGRYASPSVIAGSGMEWTCWRRACSKGGWPCSEWT